MPSLQACPVGETIPIAPGVCAPGAGSIDPTSGCCFVPNAENFLEIPSVYPPPTPTPPGVAYSGNPAAPRGLPASIAGAAPGSAGSLGGFAGAIGILVGLLGSAFMQYLSSKQQTCPQCSDGTTPAYPNCTCPQPKQCPAGDLPAPCGAGYVADPAANHCCKPALGTQCASPGFPPPCRPSETADPKTGCCLPTCPAGEYEQPCRPNENLDPATNCCMPAAVPA